MNLRRFLSQAALLLGVFLLSAGVQTFAAFSEPSVAPPGADANAPLTTGMGSEAKEGGLLLNTGGADNGLIVLLGNVGIGTGAPTQMLDVAGYVKGTGLCIADDCRTAWSDTGGSSGAVGNSAMYKVPGTYTYTVPDGVANLQVVIIGGGGGGGGVCEKPFASVSPYAYDHGDEGQTVVKNVAVTPGQQFAVIVGAGGAGKSSGAASCFGSDKADGGVAAKNLSCYDNSAKSSCGTSPVSKTSYYAGTGLGGCYGCGGRSSSGSVEILNLP